MTNLFALAHDSANWRRASGLRARLALLAALTLAGLGCAHQEAAPELSGSWGADFCTSGDRKASYDDLVKDGWSQLGQKQYAYASESFKEALCIDGNRGEAHYGYGFAVLRSSPGEAEQNLRQALARDPGNTHAEQGLGALCALYVALDKPVFADDCYGRYLARYPSGGFAGDAHAWQTRQGHGAE